MKLTPTLYPKVLMLDHGEAMESGPRSVVYWWAELGLEELERVNPAAKGAWRKSALKERLLTAGMAVAFFGLTGFSWIFLFMPDPDPNYTLINSMGAGVMLALLLGLPLSALISVYLLPLKILYVLGRVDGKPVWAAPMQIAALDENSEELVAESIANMWTREELLLGAEGWATRNFLEAIGAAKETQALRWGARQNGNVIGLDRRPPNEQGQQGG